MPVATRHDHPATAAAGQPAASYVRVASALFMPSLPHYDLIAHLPPRMRGSGASMPPGEQASEGFPTPGASRGGRKSQQLIARAVPNRTIPAGTTRQNASTHSTRSVST